MNFTELKYIAEYPGYAVTKDGRIYSDSVKRFLKQTDQNGYRKVNFNVGKGQKTLLVHRLVASMYCHKPTGCNCVNHKDGIKSHNDADNLEWVTNSQNTQHAYDTGLLKKPAGDLNGNAKLTWLNVQYIREQHFDQGVPGYKIAAQFNVTRTTIYSILSGKAWRIK